MNSAEETWRLRRDREREARREAERLLEGKSRELYHSNQLLARLLEDQKAVHATYQSAISQLSEVLLNLGGDCEANIQRLMSTGAGLLGATWCAVHFPTPGPEGRATRVWGPLKEMDLPREFAAELLGQPVSLEAPPILEQSTADGGHLWGIPLSERQVSVGGLLFKLPAPRSVGDLDRLIVEMIAGSIGTEEHKRKSGSAIRIGEQKFRALFRASVDAILILDMAGRIHEASDSAVSMFGISMGWLMRSKVSRLVAKESYAVSREAYRQLKHDGRCRFEAVMVRMDGSEFPVEMVGGRFEIGGKSRIHLIVRDITVRLRALREAGERERKFREIFEFSLDGILLYDTEGRILDVNGKLCRMLGVDRRSLLGLMVGDLLPESTRHLYSGALHRVIASGEHRFETTLRRGDDSEFIAEISSSMFTPGGEPLVQGIVRDVTDDRRARTEMRRAREEAERANAAKSMFLATMSHEMRTPLNGILGFARLLDGEPLPGEARDWVRMIRKSSEVLLSLISDLLDHSRIESGGLVLHDGVFEPRQLAQDVVELHQAAAENPRVRVVLDVAANVPDQVRGDSGRVGQVLWNLVGNALKFTSEGEVRVRLEAAMSRLHFIVTDTGPGFPAELSERLFEPFFQEDHSATRRHGGTGLGLAICRRLVQAMGGDIAARPLPQGGAEFGFHLPLKISSSRHAVIQARVGEKLHSGVAGRRLLVAEDHSINARLLLLLLNRLGHQAVHVTTGAEVIARLAEDPDFAAVLMDMRMPGMDGLEATRRLRAGEAGEGARGIPVVAVTANAMDEDRDRCLAAGMTEYLVKPIDPAELERVLARLGISGAPAVAPRRST